VNIRNKTTNPSGKEETDTLQQ